MPDDSEALVAAWERFSVPLRMKDGPDRQTFEELVTALRKCADAWRDSDSIPRLGVNVLVDIIPTMETFSDSYGESMASTLREMTYTLQELIWACVAVDPESTV
jgi:hypothetical protein